MKKTQAPARGPFVDRLEGEVAVLVEDGRERRVPLAQLPQGVKEGVWLTADLRGVDEAAAGEVAREIREIRDRLLKKGEGGGGGDFSL